MRNRSSKPSTAPRTATKPQQDRQVKKDRVLRRARELVIVIQQGETPEDIIRKGQALEEIKKLKPWKYEGYKGGFAKWAQRNLPFRAARANQYILIARNVPLSKVAGKKLCCEVLLEIARAEAADRDRLIAAAEAGDTARTLRRMAQGEEARGPDDPAARIDRVLRLLKKLLSEVAMLKEQMGQGAQVPEDKLRQVREAEAALAQLMEQLGRPAPAPAPAPQGPETDPRGSTSAPPPPAAAALHMPAEVLSFRPLFRF